MTREICYGKYRFPAESSQFSELADNAVHIHNSM